MRVLLEVISDYICPWCYVGKIRLDSIRETLKNELEIHIDLKPFILYPHIPPEGLPKSAFSKYTKSGMGRSLRFEAEKEGIAINYKLIERIPYSLEAHRMAWLIDDKELRYAFSKHVFHDYFEKGVDIGNKNYLLDLASTLEVPQNCMDHFESSKHGLEKLEEYISNNREQGISIVPSIRFGPGIVLPSLQPEEVWLKFIRRAAMLQNQLK